MKLNHILGLLLVLCGCLAIHSDARGRAFEISQSSTNSTLCLVGFTRPITIRFLDTIALTEALQQAGVSIDSIKNEVLVLRRLENSEITGIKINLKVIRKNRALDVRLDAHDVVLVTAKKKQRLTVDDSTRAVLDNCGCQLFAGMHGPLLLPKEWKRSDPSDEKKTNP